MSQPRSIALFGSNQLLCQDSWRASCVRAVLEGLHGRNFGITWFLPDGAAPKRVRFVQPPWIQATSYRTDTDQDILAALGSAAAADIIIRANDDGLFDERLDRWVFKVAPPRTQVVFWDFYPSATLERVEANPDDPFRTLVAKYDVILICGGCTSVCDAYLRLGARLCFSVFQDLDQESSIEAVSPFPVALERAATARPLEQMFEHWARELEVILRPIALQPSPV